jgi:hypothetical protein
VVISSSSDASPLNIDDASVMHHPSLKVPEFRSIIPIRSCFALKPLDQSKPDLFAMTDTTIVKEVVISEKELTATLTVADLLAVLDVLYGKSALSTFGVIIVG